MRMYLKQTYLDIITFSSCMNELFKFPFRGIHAYLHPGIDSTIEMILLLCILFETNMLSLFKPFIVGQLHVQSFINQLWHLLYVLYTLRLSFTFYPALQICALTNVNPLLLTKFLVFHLTKLLTEWCILHALYYNLIIYCPY